MRSATAAATISLWACAACHSVASDGGSAAPFDRLTRYVPAGMESIAFEEQSTVVHGLPGAWWDEGVARMVYAGRKFRATGLGTAGDFEGVIVTQYREGVHKDGDKVDGVLAEPDIVVYATRQELLEQSLRRAGAPAAVAVAALGWQGSIGWDAQFLLVRRFDRTNLADCTSPFGTDTLMGLLRPGAGLFGPRGFDADGFLMEVHETGPDSAILRLRARARDMDKMREWLVATLGAPLGNGRIANGDWSLEQPVTMQGQIGLGVMVMFGHNLMP
jgi:hypothetical protein